MTDSITVRYIRQQLKECQDKALINKRHFYSLHDDGEIIRGSGSQCISDSEFIDHMRISNVPIIHMDDISGYGGVIMSKENAIRIRHQMLLLYGLSPEDDVKSTDVMAHTFYHSLEDRKIDKPYPHIQKIRDERKQKEDEQTEQETNKRKREEENMNNDVHKKQHL
jgi:hypothetical protein